MDLKDRLNLAMRRKGMKPVDLCRETGMGSSKVSQLINGKVTDPRLSTAKLLADALGVSLDWLAGRRDTPPVQLSADEAGLLSEYRDLDPGRRENLLSNARFLASEQRKSDVQPDSGREEELRRAV